MARRPPRPPRPPIVGEDERPRGSVAWASAPPDYPVHTFNEPHSRGCGEGGVRITEIQPSGWYRGANTYAEDEQYRAMQRRKGLED